MTMLRLIGAVLVLHSAAALKVQTERSSITLSRRSLLAAPLAAAALAPATAQAAELLQAASSLQEILRPVYRSEAPLQAGDYDKAAVRAAIQKEIAGSRVLVYSYTLSPFCNEAKALLTAAGAEYKVVELGAEWIPGLLSAESAAIRAELGALTGQTSLPHVFIGGESIGGLYTGTPGLKPLIDSGRLQQKLEAAAVSSA